MPERSGEGPGAGAGGAPVRLIAIDLDDTLLTEARTIPPACVRAIERARERGVRCVLASGRMLRSARPYAVALGLDEPLICYNGALIAEMDGHILFHQPVPHGPLMELIDLAGAAGLTLNLYVGDRLFVREHNADVAYYTEVAGVAAEAVGDLRRFLAAQAGGSTKALIVAAPEAVEAWAPRLAARFAGRLQIARSKARYIEVTAPGIDKGRALAALAERMAVPPAQVMAIGDGWNDLGMIEFAGWGIAMGNAPAGVRARAAAVTGTNEEAGVAQAIERWVLSGAAGSG